MLNKIELQNLEKQYPDFFKELPAELIKLIFSDETASKISDICLKNGVKNEKFVEVVAYLVISVLLGKLPQEILPKAIAGNLKIDELAAKKISDEANRLIFSLASSLEDQKPTSAPMPAPPPEEKPAEIEKTTLPIEEEPAKEEPPRPRGKDIYHEPIV